MKNAIIINLVIIFAVVLQAGADPQQQGYIGGSGTQEDPWRIESLADFNEFAADSNYWDDCTRLETDVNLAGQTYSTAVIAPDADSRSGFQGTAFTGVFDGNGHKITGLTVDDGGAGNDYLGLFGYNRGEVRNLGLEGCSVSGDDYVGGLVGGNGYASVSNCYSTGDVSGTGRYIGGLLGSNYHTSVSNCYSTGDVSGTGVYVGGLLGWNYHTSVSNCHSTGDVSGVQSVGGLVGWNRFSSLSPLSYWVKFFQFYASVCCVELPIHRGIRFITLSLPSCNFSYHPFLTFNIL